MIPLSPISKILVVKPSSLGDIVHSLPFLNALKGSFSKAEIHWVIAENLCGLLEGHPMVDRLLIMRKDRWKDASRAFDTMREAASLVSALRKGRYDLTVDLQGLLRSGLITWASRAPVRVGFKEAREGSTLFYTHKVEGGKDIHAVNRYLKVAEALGCDISDVRFPMVSKPYPLPTDDYAVIAPGAMWETKKWPAERFGELASLLPLKSVVVGSKGDAPLADTVVRHSGGKALSVSGKTTLKELAGVVKGARFMVCNDTGPMHIAAACHIPVFALFGPTSPVRTGPYGDIHTVIRPSLPCAPCYKRKCGDLKCMESLAVKEVLAAIMERVPPRRG